MRKEKDLSSSSVKDNSRIPKPVSGSNGKVEKQDTSNSRNLRSDSRNRPIRINRDCLKGIPTTPSRVDKRTRPPFIQKVNSHGSKKGSNASPPTSAIKPRVPASSERKPRAPVPRITSHCCIKPAISQTTTQSTRVLRSRAVPKATSSIQSSKTGTVAKLSTTSTSTQTSTRILRNPVASARNAVTTSGKSNIPEFTWNLRSRSSVSKPECRTTKGDEAKPLRKRVAVKEAEGTTVKRLAVARDGSLCSKQQKTPQVVKIEEKESNQVLLVTEQLQQQKKVDLDLYKGQKSSDDLILSKPSFEKIEIQILAVSQETSLAGGAHGAPASQLEEQADSKKSAQELETKTILAKVEIKTTDAKHDDFEVKILGKITEGKLSKDAEKIPSIKKTSSALEPAMVTKPLVQEQNLEERPLTLINSEVKSLGKDQSSSDEKPVSSKSVQVEIPPVTKRECEEKSLCDDIPVVKPRLEDEIALTTSEVMSQNYRAQPSIIVTGISPNGLQETLIASAEPPTPASHVETAKLKVSNPEKLRTAKAEMPPVSKRKAEISVCDDTRAVKPRLENEITLKTSEVNSQNCGDNPSIIEADISPVKTPTLAEAIGQLRETKAEKSKSLLAEPSTVVKEQLYPVTTSACSKPTRGTRIQLTDALKIQTWKEKPLFTEFKTHKSSETSSSENAKSPWQISLDEAQGKRSLQGRAESRKRRAGAAPIENDVLTKKWRGSSPENGHHKSRASSFPDQPCSTQMMDIGSLTPAVSSQNMEVDTSGILPFAFSLTFNRFPSVLNTQSGQSISEDMELCDSGSSLTLTSPFVTNQQSLRPLFGCQPFGFSFASSSQPTGQPSFGFNQMTSQQFSFDNGFSQTGMQAKQTTFGSVPQAPPPPFDGFNQTGNHVFGNQPQQSQPSAMFAIPKAPPLPVGGFGKIGNQRFTFGSAPHQMNQSSPMFGVSFNQTNPLQTFGNASTLNMRPTLFKSDRPPREFLFTKGQRRRNVAKPWFHPNETRSQPQVFGFRPSPQQVFCDFGMVQSPTPMDSEDASNLCGTLFGGLNNQPANVFGNGCGQVIFGSLQSTPGQDLDDHAMEGILETPSFSSGMLPYRSTASCFAMSSQTMQTRPSPQRTMSLPQMAVISAVGIPASPLLKPSRLLPPSSLFAGKSFANNVLYPSVIPRGTSTNISCGTFTTRETSTNFSRQDNSFQPNLEESEVSTTLHKIYSSVSSLSSTCSNLSDCQSEIDALIETLSDCISNCSLEDNPEPNEVGKLAAKFKTLSIVDNGLM